MFQPAFDAWAQTTTDDQVGTRRREEVMLWLMDRYDGVPANTDWNAEMRCYETDIQSAGVVVECQAHAFEVPPHFVVQRIRDTPR